MSGASEAPRGLLRARSVDHHHRVTFVELFFDLVFVFAITQISHSLAEHYSGSGALHTLLILLAVWWVWIYTSWATNWLDPDRVAVRLMLFVLMLAGLVMSTHIPDAFDDGGKVFGAAFAFMQIARTAFMCRAIPASNLALRRNFQRILAWFSASGVLWIAGGLASGNMRFGLWAAALVIEYSGPYARFWTPRLGASQVSDWSIEGAHLAERCGLFVIIALGESILVTGSTFAKLPLSGELLAAFAVAFIGSIAMWWIYFDQGAELGSRQIAKSADPGRMGRIAYTYLHLPIVGGIVLSAVSDDFILAHAEARADAAHALSIVGGPLLFLAGCVLFKHTIRGWYQLSHLAGIAALAALFVLAAWILPMSQLALAAIAALILVAVSVWERLSLGALAPE